MTPPVITGYRRVKSELMNRIRDGIWPAGGLLPGEVELAQEFGCARATVNRAMRELASEGIIERKRRLGTRVKPRRTRTAAFTIPVVRAEVEALSKSYRYALVKHDTVTAPKWLCALLDLAPGARVLHLHCMHYADGAPYQFEDRWINIAAVPPVAQADFSAVGPTEWLLGAVPFTDAEISFSAAPADAALAGFLGMTPGDAVFVAERTTWLDGLSVTHARMSFARGYRMTTRY